MGPSYIRENIHAIIEHTELAVRSLHFFPISISQVIYRCHFRSYIRSPPSIPTAVGQIIGLYIESSLTVATQEWREELNELSSTTPKAFLIRLEDTAKWANNSILPGSPTAANRIKSTNIASKNVDEQSDLKIVATFTEGNRVVFTPKIPVHMTPLLKHKLGQRYVCSFCQV